MSEKRPTTYWEYVRIEQLLGLQAGLESDEQALSNDEVMFITIHQIDELWFKLAIRELVSVRNLFAQQHVREQSLSAAVRGIRRVAQIFRHAASHFELMETLTTRDYLTFRDKLSPASGFQSAQLREIEILMGLDASERLPLGAEGYLQALRYPDGRESPASVRVAARLRDTPSLRRALEDWLFRTPIDGSMPDDDNDEDVVRSFIGRYLESKRAELESIKSRSLEFALTPEDASRLEKRFSAELEGAKLFLLDPEVKEDGDSKRRRSRIRAALLFVESYRELPLLAWPREVVDSIVALEQSFTIFRQRHARMVERIIGRRTGTGGSAGVEYLDQTALRYRVFRDAWAVRTLLLRDAALPALERAEFYGFAGPTD